MDSLIEDTQDTASVTPFQRPLTRSSSDPYDRPYPEPFDRPYPGPYDTPLLIDAVRRLDGFDMTRCLFFSIDATASVDDWVASLRAQHIPFMLLGVSPVLHRPDLETARFTNAAQIDRLFSTIEDHDGLVVETAHTWLPTMLFETDNRFDLAPGSPDSAARRGTVWRASLPLLQTALRFQHELISSKSFDRRCRALMQTRAAPLTFSPEETEAFRSWSGSQIEAARQNYEQQRMDPRRRVLRWRDARGRFRAG